MRKLLILALLFEFACHGEETIIAFPCGSMILSDANPVQFWPINCETWNESRPPGVHHYCFCQPFECDDEIKVNFDSNDVISSEQLVSHFNTNFDGWFNTANGVTPSTGGTTANWAWSADFGGSLKVTTFDVFGTKGLRLSGVSLPQKPFTLRVKFAISDPRNSSQLELQFLIRDSSNNQLMNTDFGSSSTGLQETKDFLITDPDIWTLADHFWIVSSSTSYVAGDDLHIIEISYIYDVPQTYQLLGYNSNQDQLFYIDFLNDGGSGYKASFVPSDYSICDDEITLAISISSTTPDTEVYKSDCILIKESHDETVLINYSNHTNFAGITYGDQSPDPSFNIRIPAIFFEERLPQEGEDIQLSNNKIIALNSQLRVQRLLSTSRMPKYMHLKMALVLQHQFLYIYGEYWVKGSETYEKTEKSNKRDSFDMYTCWLTRKDYVVRNIL